MRIILILSSNKQWYIHSSSSLEHHNHPPLKEEATLLSQKDLSDKDEQLINNLCDANVPPPKISMTPIRVSLVQVIGCGNCQIWKNKLKHHPVMNPQTILHMAYECRLDIQFQIYKLITKKW